MTDGRPRRGPTLPYQLIAGVIPVGFGWLIVGAKLQGVTTAPEEPMFVRTFIEVLDMKPAYSVLALDAPIGLPDTATPLGRDCDRAARALLHWPRSTAIASAPCRSAVSAPTYDEAHAENGGQMSAAVWRRLRQIGEIDEAMAPYWQRTVYEVSAELSFYQINGDVALRYSKRSSLGIEERRSLLLARLPGSERIFVNSLPRISLPQLIDGAICLWAARRISSRAVERVPEDPVWDSSGLRMQIVR